MNALASNYCLTCGQKLEADENFTCAPCRALDEALAECETQRILRAKARNLQELDAKVH